jgi:hypothetical protein
MTDSIVGRGEADSVAAHTKGFRQNLINTTTQSFDMSAWVGRYVKIGARVGTVYYCWGPLSTLNTPVLVGLSSDCAVNTVGVADDISAGSYAFEVISAEAPVINVQASANNTILFIIPK